MFKHAPLALKSYAPTQTASDVKHNIEQARNCDFCKRLVPKAASLSFWVTEIAWSVKDRGNVHPG